MSEFDAIVVGAGHNGLVAANYLARGGARVLVLERRTIVGGACVTEEPWPGFRINTYAYLAGLLRPQIVEDLELNRYGYRTQILDPQTFVPFPDGRALRLWVDSARTAREIARFSPRDARAYPEYVHHWDEILELIQPLLMAPPPAVADLFELFRSPEAERLVRDLFLRSAKDLLDDWFESEEVKAALAANANIGTFTGPYTPGSAYVLAHHTIGLLDGHSQVWGFSMGGMGRITEALARSAIAHGVEIRTSTPVRSLLVHQGRVQGVETENGDRFHAPVVASNLDARTTFLALTPPEALPEEFRREVGRIRYRGAQIKFNAALDALPEVPSAPGTPSDAHRAALEILPSIDYVERAYVEAKSGRLSSRPFMDVLFQSASDPSVAPPGKHTMTAFVQYAPYRLAGGVSWEEFKPRAAEIVLETLEAYAPSVRKTIRHWQVVSPVDLERTLGLTGGSIFQGDITPDQILSFRPLPGWAQYRTPVAGLYLCGSAAHPGGGVTGAPGYLAAQAILEDRPGATASSAAPQPAGA
jgi:phytoene dehydrogenase-like protein